jgi:hypothetical protein
MGLGLRFLTIALFLSTGIVVGAPVSAQTVVAIAEAWKETMKTVGTIFDGFSKSESIANQQLSEDKKNALAAISKNLIDIAAVKRSMAQQLVCLGQNQGQAGAPGVLFNQCWQAFESQNVQLSAYLSQLKKNMNLADPVWCSEHQTELKAIDSLYWEKVGLSQKTLTFVESSQSGWVLRQIHVDAQQDEILAKALEAGADELDAAAAKFANALRTQ